jgi:hypothetical protein
MKWYFNNRVSQLRLVEVVGAGHDDGSKLYIAGFPEGVTVVDLPSGEFHPIPHRSGDLARFTNAASPTISPMKRSLEYCKNTLDLGQRWRA